MDEAEKSPRPESGLERLSVDELVARIDALRADIAACEAELSRKQAHQSAADALFADGGPAADGG
jgi:uncharacterized small protein (DUF1192 family)